MNQKKQSQSWLVLLLFSTTLIAVGITVWTLFFNRTEDVVLVPDRAPQTEQFAEPIPDDNGKPTESPKGGGSVSLTYSNQVTVDLSDETASLIFANPGKSNQDMVVQVVIRDVVIVQSGRLEPGTQVTTLPLLDGTAQKLSPGGYEGKFAVFYYNRTTGEKAVVNTEIPVSITVKS